MVLPALVAAGALIGAGLRSLSRQAQEQVTPLTPQDPATPCSQHRGCPTPAPSLSLSPPQVAKATVVADEVLGNVRTVRAFAMEDRQAG